jgi:hypothetical protein
MRWAIVIAVIGVVFVYVLYTGIVAVLSSIGPGPAAMSASPPPPAPTTAVAASTPAMPRAESSSSVPSTANAPVTPPRVGVGVATPVASAPVERTRPAPWTFNKEMTAALRDFKSRLATCPDSGRQSGFGGDVAAEQGAKRVSLVLDLAMRDGSVEIVDVPRTKRGRRSGHASEEFLTCARNVLRGRVVPVEAARAGGRRFFSFRLGTL